MDLITSKDNPNIKLYSKLSSSKKYRKEYGMFVLEGLRICEDAIKENAELHCMLISQTSVVKYGEALNLLYENHQFPIYIITDELGNKIADTSASQGVFVIAKKNITYDISLVKNNGKYIILNHLQDPGNIGTIIRTADAVGIEAVILYDCCDIYNPKTIRSTMGSIFRIPIIEVSDIKDTLDYFKSKNITTYASVIDNNAKPLTQCDFSFSSAVMIGNEGSGISDAIADECDYKLTIKMSGNINSLNAAMAAVIIMWEMGRE